MGRLFGWLIGAPLAAAAAVFAVANRTSVVADLWPLPWSVEAPLYLFVLFALFAGFLAGAAVAWASSLAARRRVRAQARSEIEAARRAAAAGAARLPAASESSRRNQDGGGDSIVGPPTGGTAAGTPPQRPLLPPFA